MKLSMLFRNWWGILIQGILLIVLSIIIFNNPEAVLIALAFWLGVTVIITALAGITSYFTTPKENQDIFTLLGSLASFILGILMITKVVITMKAISLGFGVISAIVGLVLISGSWSGRKQWSLWWIIALIGVSAFITGIKSCLDIYAGAESISNLYGAAVLISGIGLVILALLKRKVVMAIKNKLQ